MVALVFSSFVPSKDKMSIVKEIFNVFIEYFSDVDFYIGINGDPCPEYLAYLESLKPTLNIEYAIVPKSLEVPSDVSAYQLALKLLHDSKKEYELIWFGHLKGVTSKQHHWRKIFITQFLKERHRIENLLRASNAGTYSLYLTKYKGIKNFKDVLIQYYNFEKPYFYTYLYLFTFYVCKGKYLHKFLNNCTQEFFTTNLITNGGDIYMFERDIPHIIWRLGGYPLYKFWDSTHVLGGAHPENHYYEDIRKYYD